jgi:hypothetical protein
MNPVAGSEPESDDDLLLPAWIRAFTVGTRGAREWGKITLSDRFRLLTKQSGSISNLFNLVSGSLDRC